MKTLKLTKLEILNETIRFYAKNTKLRALDFYGNCKYNTDNDKHCAVGRCLLKKYQKQGEKMLGNVSVADGLAKMNDKDSLDSMLSAKYRGHDISFWLKLQELHDGERNWNAIGLTVEGKYSVMVLRKIFKNEKTNSTNK